jgi:hypothetical protein
LIKYGGVDSKVVLGRKFDQPGFEKLDWEYTVITERVDEIEALVSDSDIVHYHQHIFPKFFLDKKTAIQYHAQPAGYKPQVTHRELNGRKLVVCNYQALYYCDAQIVPNMLDIWDDTHLFPKKNNSKIRILFTSASETPSGWGYKGSKEVLEALRAIKQKFGVGVESQFITNQPYSEIMKNMRMAHFFIGDCASGAFHQSEIQALACGAVCFSAIKPEVERIILNFTGAKRLPIIKTSVSTLVDDITKTIENGNIRMDLATEGREWVEKYWDPRKQVNEYLNFYKKIC